MHKKICPHCGDEFFAFNPKRIFCSKNCAGKYRRQNEQRICEFCGKPFLLQKNNPAQKFCSPKCYNAARRTKPKEPPPVIPVDKTFDDWIREADECNLDYGTYRGLIKMGKTYDELKATADRRTISVHAHGGAVSKKNYRD